MEVKQTQSRVDVSNATFSFLRAKSTNKIRLKLFCAGAGENHVDVEDPLDDLALNELMTELRSVSKFRAKKTLKIPVSFFTSVRITFSGYDADKGFKVRAYITGFLFFSSSASTRSYLSTNELDRLISNLEQCID